MSRPQLKKDPAMGAFSRNKKGVSHSIVLTESDDDHARMRYLLKPLGFKSCLEMLTFK